MSLNMKRKREESNLLLDKMMYPVRHIRDSWGVVGSACLTCFLFMDMLRRYCPPELRRYLEKCTVRLTGFLNPHIDISIHEYIGNHMFKPHEAYTIVEAYLSTVNSSRRDAKRFKAEMVKDKNFTLSMDEYQMTTDEFKGVHVKWISGKAYGSEQSFSYYPEPDRRYYRLKFHKRHMEMITESYLEHVIEKGREFKARNRQRRLYTNGGSNSKSGAWSCIMFDHPAKFDTLAMDPLKKEEIVEDLMTFSKSKDYYARIGKAWKRGYLLYGPPGTGKSTMIAAMANLLDYDVYDLELTSVKDNAELKRLLTETKTKSIIVIEDIDCSLDLTGQRKKEEKPENTNIAEKEQKNGSKKESTTGCGVTLSGLLNCIDGLASACAVERVTVFTTNYAAKLDAALTRRGRMDKHIELSYCKYEGFKVLAKNYLEIEGHELFKSVEELIEEVDITPADVAESLMPKSAKESPEKCLMNLICTLEEAKRRKTIKSAEAKAETNDDMN